jgi:hypothetical protein
LKFSDEINRHLCRAPVTKGRTMTKRDISSSNGDHKPVKSWRDVLKVHPAALEYPRLSEAELVELGKDIAARGGR